MEDRIVARVPLDEKLQFKRLCLGRPGEMSGTLRLLVRKFIDVASKATPDELRTAKIAVGLVLPKESIDGNT